MGDFDWKALVAFLALGWGVLNSIWTRHVANQNVTRKEIEAVSQRVAAAEQNLTALKATVDQLPDRDMVHSIELTVTEMKGGLQTLNERVKPWSRSLERIEDYLMKQGRNS